MTERQPLTGEQTRTVVHYAKKQPIEITESTLRLYNFSRLSEAQRSALRQLAGQRYQYTWELAEALAGRSPQWRPRADIPPNRRFNKRLEDDLAYLVRTFERHE
jgi:hypothetical protein